MPVPAGGGDFTDLYTDLVTVKSALGKASADDRDELISAAIMAASRMIDARTGRRFYLDDVASARVFPTHGRTFWDGVQYQLLVDDLGDTSSLVVETGSNTTNTWAALTGYDTGPANAILQGRPVTVLALNTAWPTGSTIVRVTGRWGWPAVPAEVALAAQLLAARLYRRKDSPQGVIGNAEWGAVRVARVDPDVEALIAHLILPGFA